jgi:hypothetical protein
MTIPKGFPMLYDSCHVTVAWDIATVPVNIKIEDL